MKTLWVFLAATCCAVAVLSCGSSRVNVNTKLTSTTLASRSSRALETAGCGTGYSSCITPTSVTGKAYYAGMIVGASNGLSLGPLLGSVENPASATSFATSDLIDFDFSQGITSAGQPSLGGPIPYPADAQAIIQNAHIYFGWVDFTFVLANTDAGVHANLHETHTVRVVMANIDGTELTKGDVLYHNSGSTTFNWCTSGGGCAFPTTGARPSSPLQMSDVANFSNTSGEGNATIPSFFASLASGHAEIQVTESSLRTSTPTFTWDFTMTKGIKFTTNLSAGAVTTIYDMLAATRLPADPGDENSGFTVTITKS